MPRRPAAIVSKRLVFEVQRVVDERADRLARVSYTLEQWEGKSLDSSNYAEVRRIQDAHRDAQQNFDVVNNILLGLRHLGYIK